MYQPNSEQSAIGWLKVFYEMCAELIASLKEKKGNEQ